MPLAPPIVSETLGAAQTVVGLINAGKAKREAKKLENSRPEYDVNPLYGQNLDLAESEVGGLSARGEQAYNQLNDKQFSSSLDAILKSGGSANNISTWYGSGEEGRLKLAQLNDELRMNQIRNVIAARTQVADQDDKAWQWNTQAPWLDKSQATAEARKGADQMIWSGLQTLGSSAMQGIDLTNQGKKNDEYLKIPKSDTGGA